MSPEPNISVLTTVYNNADFLEATMRSVLAQTYTGFEYVVVDDGSTDGSAEIMDRVAREDSRVRVIRRGHMGISKAANLGLASCRAPWVARLDGDDLAFPDRLEKQLAFAEEKGLVCAGGAVDFVDAKGRLLTTILSPCEHDAIEEPMLRGHNTIWHSGCIFRRQAALDLGGYAEDMDAAIDLDLFLRLGEVGRLGNSTDRTIQYRLHNKSVSAQRRQYQRDMAKLACDRAAERRGIAPRFDAEEMWRPGEDRASRHAFALRFGWWAFNSGERATARVYGCKAIAAMPWRSEGWRLLACGMLKHAPKREATGTDHAAPLDDPPSDAAHPATH